MSSLSRVTTTAEEFNLTSASVFNLDLYESLTNKLLDELNILPRVERQVIVGPHSGDRLFPTWQCLIYDPELIEDIRKIF